MKWSEHIHGNGIYICPFPHQFFYLF
ncbi:hypothetical protein NITGR_190007 [Nitrospina gracilis 3/211]|uniref:Uncharacterized protein n=1 Tax=Nitrospina gracilis (strain 3/211) TaxID=1266370 RepID=M1Z9P0_NITG3|nr:hypothetical protein NITGR_190007 [Nitrospina gracilis 3/211]